MKAMHALTKDLAASGLLGDKFETWADEVRMSLLPNWLDNGYTVNYTINVFISDCSMPAEQLLLWLSNWISQHLCDDVVQPELLIEPTSNGNSDIGIKIEMSEDYALHRNDAGEWLLEDGLRYSLTSSFVPATDWRDLGYLLIVDNHTQDPIGTV